MFKTLFTIAVSLVSHTAFSQTTGQLHSLEDVNKPTGLEVIIVAPVYTPYPVAKRLPTFTDEQYDCVQQTVQAVKEAGRGVYGSVDAFAHSLKTSDIIYRIELTDSTGEATRKVYGEGKQYAHRNLSSDEIRGSIFTRTVVSEHISMYLDPETGKVACAAASAKSVEEFLRETYQPYIDTYRR